jgi:hypothetical protein
VRFLEILTSLCINNGRYVFSSAYVTPGFAIQGSGLQGEIGEIHSVDIGEDFRPQSFAGSVEALP